MSSIRTRWFSPYLVLLSASLHMPIPGIYLFRGVCAALAGRAEQCIVQPGEVVFLLVLTDQAYPGDNLGLNIVGLEKNCLPRADDVTGHFGLA